MAWMCPYETFCLGIVFVVFSDGAEFVPTVSAFAIPRLGSMVVRPLVRNIGFFEENGIFPLCRPCYSCGCLTVVVGISDHAEFVPTVCAFATLLFLSSYLAIVGSDSRCPIKFIFLCGHLYCSGSRAVRIVEVSDIAEFVMTVSDGFTLLLWPIIFPKFGVGCDPSLDLIFFRLCFSLILCLPGVELLGFRLC